MLIRKAYKYRLKVPKSMEGALLRYTGCCRFIWNYFWHLNQYRLDNGYKIMFFHEMSHWLTILKSSEEYGFLSEAPRECLQYTIKTLSDTYIKCFKKQCGKPKVKRKDVHDVFHFYHSISIEGNSIRIPKLGYIKFIKSREIEGAPKNVTVSRHCGNWYVSIQAEQEIDVPVNRPVSAIGIDVGVAEFASLSDGTVYPAVNAFHKTQKKIAWHQRKLNNKVKFSNNWRKQQERIRKQYQKVVNIRKDYLHKVSNDICKNHTKIIVEDLNIPSMLNKGRNFNKAILDQGWHEFFRQLEYKSSWRGGVFIKVNPAYTSQTCFECGHVNKKNRKGQKEFVCMKCKHKANADINASKNILAVGNTVTACLSQE